MLIIITEENVVCAPLESGILENDTGRELYLQDVVAITLPSCDIERTLFEDFTYFSRIGIEKHKPVIVGNLEGENIVQSLKKAIETHQGFIAPLEEIKKLICDDYKTQHHQEGNPLKNNQPKVVIPSEILIFLRRVPEFRGALKRAASKCNKTI